MTIHSAYYLFPSSKDEPSLPSKLISLSYYNPVTQMYGVGKDDLWLVLYWIVAFTLLRDGAMQYVFKPWAQWGGVKTQKGLVRFAEQAWLMVYYTVFWTLGMVDTLPRDSVGTSTDGSPHSS